MLEAIHLMKSVRKKLLNPQNNGVIINKILYIYIYRERERERENGFKKDKTKL